MSTPQDAAPAAPAPPPAPTAATAKAKAAPTQQQPASGGSRRSKRSNKGGGQPAQPGGGDRERGGSERGERGGQAAAQQKLKIVVRRLPANIPEDVFWASTAAWVNDETAGWRTFRKGKLAKSCVRPSSSSSPAREPDPFDLSLSPQRQQGADPLAGVHPIQEPAGAARVPPQLRRAPVPRQGRSVPSLALWRSAHRCCSPDH